MFKTCEKFSASLTLKEMHIKMTLKYNFLLGKNPGVWWRCDGQRQGKRFFHCWANVNWCNFYGSQHCSMLQNYKCFCLVSGFLCGSVGKESTCSAGYLGWYLGQGKIPCRRQWQPTPVLLPGEFHGQRSRIGCSPWNHRVGHDCATNFHFLFTLLCYSLYHCTSEIYLSYKFTHTPKISMDLW